MGYVLDIYTGRLYNLVVVNSTEKVMCLNFKLYSMVVCFVLNFLLSHLKGHYGS